MKWLKRVWFQFRCPHENKHFWRNIYGDGIIYADWKRSIWQCSRCGKFLYEDELHREEQQ